MTDSLRSILARYPASVRPTTLPIPLGNAGGSSGSRLWKFDSARGPLVARQWPNDDSDRLRIERIHLWLSRTSHLRFVPQPITGRDGRSVQCEFGKLWEITPWMPGHPDLATPPNLDHVRSAFAALAEFHSLLGEISRNTTSAGLISRVSEIEALLDRDLDLWMNLVSKATVDESQRLAKDWLGLAQRLAPHLLPEIREAAAKPIVTQPVLRDVRPDHFLFSSGQITGLVDFGAMSIDAVSADLARLLNEWLAAPDLTSRNEAIASYERIRPLSVVEKESIRAFESSADLLRGARWVRWQFVEKREFANPDAILRGLRKSVEHARRLSSITPASGWLRHPPSIDERLRR